MKEHFNWDKKGEFLREIYESVAAMPNAAELCGPARVGDRSGVAP